MRTIYVNTASDWFATCVEHIDDARRDGIAALTVRLMNGVTLVRIPVSR